VEPFSLTLQTRENPGISDLLRLSQQAATGHLEVLGLSGAAEAQGLVWVIIRIRGEIFAQPDSLLRVETWPGATKGSIMPRYCRMYNRDGACCAGFVTLWVLADIQTRQMRLDAAVDVPDHSRGDEPPLPRALPPRRGLPPVGSFVPRQEHIDSNGHMNNAAYPEAALEFFPGLPLPRVFSLDYRREILPGMQVSVLGDVRDGVLTVSGCSEGREHFRMALQYSPDSKTPL